jgi:hypothetical protein
MSARSGLSGGISNLNLGQNSKLNASNMTGGGD